MWFLPSLGSPWNSEYLWGWQKPDSATGSLPFPPDFLMQSPLHPTKVQAVAKGLKQGTGEGRPNMLGEETGRLGEGPGIHIFLLHSAPRS